MRIPAAIVLAGIASAAAAGPWQDAQDLIRRGDMTAAVPLLMQTATNPDDPNSAAAQYLLGNYFETDTGTNVDFTTAARWYRRAAERGHVQAGIALGAMYAAGRGLTQDYAEAARWLSLAAKAGTADAGVRPD